MTRSNGPFVAPTESAEPGLARPLVALVMVFVVGMACVGLIYAVGDPADETSSTSLTENVESAAITTPEDTEPQAPGAPSEASAVVAPGKAYVSPGGTSPFPKYGEPQAPPIPPTRLIDEQAFNAKPPAFSTLPAPDGPVPWDQAHKYLGQTITVRGTIVDANNIGNICFLNYDPNWQDKFYVAMFREAFELLPDPPEQHYLNKILLVTGTVTLHKDRPQIEVHDDAQIEVVE